MGWGHRSEHRAFARHIVAGRSKAEQRDPQPNRRRQRGTQRQRSHHENREATWRWRRSSGGSRGVHDAADTTTKPTPRPPRRRQARERHHELTHNNHLVRIAHDHLRRSTVLVPSDDRAVFSHRTPNSILNLNLNLNRTTISTPPRPPRIVPTLCAGLAAVLARAAVLRAVCAGREGVFAALCAFCVCVCGFISTCVSVSVAVRRRGQGPGWGRG